MRLRILVALALVAASLPLFARAATSEVAIQGYAFSPDPLAVRSGDTVVWRDHDNTAHTATTTSGPEAFDTGSIAPGGTASWTAQIAGTYAYQCSIHPNMTGTIVVQDAGDRAPTAEFSWSPAAPQAGAAVQFTDASTDPDGTIASWNWSFGDGATSAEKDPTHTYAAAGSYQATLRVKDDAGVESAAATKPIAVSASPHPANVTVDFSVSPDFPRTGLTVTLTDASRDADGAIVSWSWDWGDGATGDGRSATHAYAKHGDYAVGLTVTDDHGAAASLARSLSVRDPPAPAIVLNVQGLVVAADASGSTADNGTIADATWSWSDGAKATGLTTTHAFAQPGAYSVTLTLKDDHGIFSNVTRDITVNATGPTSPTSNATAGPRVDFSMMPSPANASDVVTFSPFVDDSGAVVAEWAWDFGDGATAQHGVATHAYKAPGNYTVTLRVKDTLGRSGSGQRAIVVHAAVTPATIDKTATNNTNESTEPDGIPAPPLGLVLVVLAAVATFASRRVRRP